MILIQYGRLLREDVIVCRSCGAKADIVLSEPHYIDRFICECGTLNEIELSVSVDYKINYMVREIKDA